MIKQSKFIVFFFLFEKMFKKIFLNCLNKLGKLNRVLCHSEVPQCYCLFVEWKKIKEKLTISVLEDVPKGLE